MSIHTEYHRKSVKTPNYIFIAAIVIAIVLIVIFLASAFNKDDKGNVSSNIASLDTSSKIVSSEVISSVIASSESTTTSSQKSSSEVKSSSSSKPVASQNIITSSQNVSSSQNIEAMVPNGDWRLVVANKQYPLPESYKIDVSYVSGNYRLDSRIADAYKQMITAAKNDGISLVIISGFRTYQGQTSLFNNKVNQYINSGYSREKAKELAAQYVAPPGTSEHLTGLAVDLISPDWYNYNSDLNSNFENTKQFEWLYNNCAKYGFCLRYPKDKVSITGYNYEPWHYRYVGVEAATEIMNRKICLEEYVGL